MKKSKLLVSPLCVTVCTSLLEGVSATDYVGIAIDDVFVWELYNGEYWDYVEYKITEISEIEGNITATANLTVYDVFLRSNTEMPESKFTYFYTESILKNLSTLGMSVSNETRSYGGLERDCYVVTGVMNFSGAITIDAMTGIFLEMTINPTTSEILSSGWAPVFWFFGFPVSFKLVAWEDTDLTKYRAGESIQGFRLAIVGICTVVSIVPMVFSLRKYRLQHHQDH